MCRNVSTGDLCEQALAWLCRHYTEYCFFTERDIVWTVQTYLLDQIEGADLACQVYNDYPILPGLRRSLSADLAIVNANGVVESVMEFKYEPAHHRSDILKQKLPVVDWTSVIADIQRVHDFVAQSKASTGYSVFIDEGGAFQHRRPPANAEWQEWGSGRWVLLSRVSTSSLHLDRIEHGPH